MVPATPDHRRRLLEEVSRFPGLHLREIARSVAIPPSHAQYHLRVLEKTGLVRAEKEGPNLRFYPTKTTPVGPILALDPETRRLLVFLRSMPVLRVLVLLSVEPSSTLATLARRIGTSPSTVLYHLRRLETAGLVLRSQTEHDVRWALRDAALVRRLLIEYEPPPPYLEGFLDVWQRLSP